MATSLVIPAAELTLNVLNAVLGALGSIDRKIAIGLKNNTGFAWSSPRIYFNSGTADKGLPADIATGYALAFGARKTTGPVARGTVGVITYYIATKNVTVALMWSVPFDYNLYSNWWNITVLNGNQPASSSLYNNLYYNWNPFEGDSNYYTRSINVNGTWRFSGSMGASGTPTMDVNVTYG